MSIEHPTTGSADDTTTDSLRLEWERKLTQEGLPAEPDSHHVLPTKIAQQVRKAYEAFYRDNQVPPTTDELAEHTQTSPERKRQLLEYGLRADFDAEMQLDLEETPATDDLSNQSEIEERDDLSVRLHAILDTLSEREAGIVLMRYGFVSEDGEPMTLDEIGEIYGVSRERSRQILLKALSRLREPNRSLSLIDYWQETLPPRGIRAEHGPPTAMEKVEQFKQNAQRRLLAECLDYRLPTMRAVRNVSQNPDLIAAIIDSAANSSGIDSGQVRRLLIPFYQTLLENSAQKTREPKQTHYDDLYRSVLAVLQAYY